MVDKIRHIVVFTGNRAEYGLLQPVIRLLAAEQAFKVYLIVSGSHLDPRFGKTVQEIETHGINRIFRVHDQHDDIADINVHRSFSSIVDQCGNILKEINADIILLAGDRHETFAMAVAAFYSLLPLAHLFGGDLSQGGHLDDSVRHAITKLAHLHFTSSQDSYSRILGLGEEPWRVHNVGSTAVDSIMNADYTPSQDVYAELDLDRRQPVILFTQHPITTMTGEAYNHAKESLEALKEFGHQTVITYPCSDPGAEDIIRAIEEYQDIPFFRIRKSLGHRLYLGCMHIAACVAGNSSSGLIETPAFKVPCVNIGPRQNGRLRAENVIDVPSVKREILKALRMAISDESFLSKTKSCTNPYGDGTASKHIVQILRTITLSERLVQKKMTY